MIQRGDIVVALFPYVGGSGSKNRPAVVVQCDALNGRIDNTILAMITGNTRLATREPTQFLIDPASLEGRSSGLAHLSAVKCENLMTVAQADILRTLGHLSVTHLLQLNSCLEAVLEI